MTKKTTASSFEKNLQDLETIVQQLEAGDLPLEESLKQFEQGIGLARDCQRALQEAEHKVQILMQKTPAAIPQPFTADDANDDK